jgi:hypothetical protein
VGDGPRRQPLRIVGTEVTVASDLVGDEFGNPQLVFLLRFDVVSFIEAPYEARRTEQGGSSFGKIIRDGLN